MRVRWLLRNLAASDHKIVCGPWHSELGFEVLYWLPFLHWAMHRYGITPERCLAVSRGGMGTLYGVPNAVDLFDIRTVAEVRLESAVDAETVGIQKQVRVSEWDRAVVAEAAERAFGKAPYRVLHPMWMYWLFEPWWEERTGLQHIMRHTRYEQLPVPVLPKDMELPKEFIAVRFYERATLPFVGEVRQIATRLVQQVASRMPVVLLNQPDLVPDDHTDLPVQGPNIFALPKVEPHKNFLLQAAILARAQAFLGTYGGVAQWALRYGRPSMSFYLDFRGTAYAHRTLSHAMSAASGIPFEVLSMRMHPFCDLVFQKIGQKADAQRSSAARQEVGA